MKLNPEELGALLEIAVHHFPECLSVDVSVIDAVGGLGYVLAIVRPEGQRSSLQRYLVSPSGKKYTVKFNDAGGIIAGDEIKLP